MFNEKEMTILKALVEEELIKLMGIYQEETALIDNYNHSLSKILLKMDIGSHDIFSSENCSNLMKDFASRQAV
ncbi:MAG: hypothetical protein PHQ52_04260 [Candidatus Omnitrophica bacterium]|nr:hypothetical protein [Candidatus Omnitrophota bacterium]